jgi:hypothetical protein
MSSLVARLHDAAVTPEAWPDALTALTDAAGVAGAALIIFNKSTGKVDEAHFCGLSAGFKSDYVRHHAALDPYSPLLDGSWKKLSECLPDRLLRSSEWYNDFILTCGVRDILGARLVDTSGRCVILGIHQQIGRSFSDSVDSVVSLAGIPLKHAAWRHIERLSSPRSAIFDLSQTEFRLKEAGFISTLTTSAGMRTKRDRFFRRPMRPRRMPLLLPRNSRKMAAGTDLPFSLRTTGDTRSSVCE